jgi:hypothetical protein
MLDDVVYMMVSESEEKEKMIRSLIKEVLNQVSVDEE